MKCYAISGMLLVVVATAVPVREALAFGPKKKEAVRTTAYTHTESDHLEYGRKTAIGTTLRNDKSYTSAAADWSKYPVGTKFKIEGMDTTFVVDDYGRALVGTETIDIYHPSKSAMNRWGVRHVDIEVLEMGDFDRSREILAQRTKYAHVRKMLAGIDHSAKSDDKGWSLFKPAKKSTTPAEAPAPAKPPVPVAPAADPKPALQLASAAPAPKPASPAPAPAPPVPTAPKTSAPAPAPAPVVAAAPAPAPVKPAAAPTPAEIIAASAAPVSIAPGTPAPVPTVPRRIRPLTMELASAGVVATETHAPAAVAPAEPRKRAFRPL